MDDVKVTIITPCFNSEKTIRRTIESVINQTYDNIEYIILDGGSTDKTIDIIKEYDSYGIIFQSEKDNGVYDAMNKGIKKASGDLIGIINSDDWYELDAVSNIVNSFDGKRYEIIYGVTTFWNKDEIQKVAIFMHNAIETQMISHPSCFVTESIYREIAIYDERYRSSADYDFFLKIIKKHPEVSFVPLEKKIANFSFGGISGSDLAFLETTRIRYKYGIINRRRVVINTLIVRLHMLKGKINGCMCND